MNSTQSLKMKQQEFEQLISEFLDLTNDPNIEEFRKPLADWIDNSMFEYSQDVDYFLVNGTKYSDFREHINRLETKIRQCKLKGIPIKDLGVVLERLDQELICTCRQMKIPSIYSYTRKTFKTLISGGSVNGQFIPSYYVRDYIYHPYHNRARREILHTRYNLIEMLVRMISIYLSHVGQKTTVESINHLYSELVGNRVIGDDLPAFQKALGQEGGDLGNKVVWRLTDKSGKNTSKASLIFFITHPKIKVLLPAESDPKEWIESYFSDHEGKDFNQKNLSQSFSQYRKDSSQKDYIPLGGKTINNIIKKVFTEEIQAKN